MLRIFEIIKHSCKKRTSRSFIAWQTTANASSTRRSLTLFCPCTSLKVKGIIKIHLQVDLHVLKFKG